MLKESQNRKIKHATPAQRYITPKFDVIKLKTALTTLVPSAGNITSGKQTIIISRIEEMNIVRSIFTFCINIRLRVLLRVSDSEIFHNQSISFSNLQANVFFRLSKMTPFDARRLCKKSLGKSSFGITVYTY